MAANVKECINIPHSIRHDKEWIPCHLVAGVLAWDRELGLVRNNQPGFGEDCTAFELVELWLPEPG